MLILLLERILKENSPLDFLNHCHKQYKDNRRIIYVLFPRLKTFKENISRIRKISDSIFELPPIHFGKKYGEEFRFHTSGFKVPDLLLIKLSGTEYEKDNLLAKPIDFDFDFTGIKCGKFVHIYSTT
jgi:hypothetical protein